MFIRKNKILRLLETFHSPSFVTHGYINDLLYLDELSQGSYQDERIKSFELKLKEDNAKEDKSSSGWAFERADKVLEQIKTLELPISPYRIRNRITELEALESGLKKLIGKK